MLKINKILLRSTFFISAIFYSLAYKFPEYSLAFIPAFFIFFFYSIFHGPLSFKDGFIWGLIAYAIHVYAAFQALTYIADLGIAFSSAIFILVYISLYPAFWFYIIYRIFSKSKYYFIIWPIALYIYFSFMSYGLFWIFDNFEGYGILCPLVPLMAFNFFGNILVIFGKEILLILLLLSSSCIAWLLQKYRIDLKVFYSIIIIFIIIIFISDKSRCDKSRCNKSRCNKLHHQSCLSDSYSCKSWKIRPNAVGTYITLDADPQDNVYLWDRAVEISENLKLAQLNQDEKNKEEKVFFLPESAFPFSLDRYPDIVNLWTRILKENQYLVLGGYRSSIDGLECYNSLYIISKDGIEKFYDKGHRMLFTERMPKILKGLSFLGFYKNRDFFLKGSNKDSNNCLNIYPIICSELFFNKINFKANRNCLYVVLVNDLWFKNTYLPNILALFAKLISYNYNINIVYISYSQADFFNLKTLE